MLAQRNSSSAHSRAVDRLSFAVGTAEGLFFVGGRHVDGPLFAGAQVTSFLQIDDSYLAAILRRDGSSSLEASDDGGISWRVLARTPAATTATSPSTTAGISAGIGDHALVVAGSVEPIWQITRDRRRINDAELLLGTFQSRLLSGDRAGTSLGVLADLSEYLPPDVSDDGPGAQGIHTILTHPERPDRLLVGISPGGVFRSDDGGKSFLPSNEGFLIGDGDGDGVGEGVGVNCVHKLAVDAVDPDLIWAQHHCGVYRSSDAGAHWQDVGRLKMTDGLPSGFGFPIVAHPAQPETAYVFPLTSAGFRRSAEGRARVFRTVDGGESWRAIGLGLPDSDAYVSVARDCLVIGDEPPYPIAFGALSGEIFGSVDDGKSWRPLVRHLPPILCIALLF